MRLTPFIIYRRKKYHNAKLKKPKWNYTVQEVYKEVNVMEWDDVGECKEEGNDMEWSDVEL